MMNMEIFSVDTILGLFVLGEAIQHKGRKSIVNTCGQLNGKLEEAI